MFFETFYFVFYGLVKNTQQKSFFLVSHLSEKTAVVETTHEKLIFL